MMGVGTRNAFVSHSVGAPRRVSASHRFVPHSLRQFCQRIDYYEVRPESVGMSPTRALLSRGRDCIRSSICMEDAFVRTSKESTRGKSHISDLAESILFFWRHRSGSRDAIKRGPPFLIGWPALLTTPRAERIRVQTEPPIFKRRLFLWNRALSVSWFGGFWSGMWAADATFVEWSLLSGLIFRNTALQRPGFFTA